jgi:hypothetical protein
MRLLAMPDSSRRRVFFPGLAPSTPGGMRLSATEQKIGEVLQEKQNPARHRPDFEPEPSKNVGSSVILPRVKGGSPEKKEPMRAVTGKKQA